MFKQRGKQHSMLKKKKNGIQCFKKVDNDIQRTLLVKKKLNKLFKILNNPKLTGESLNCCLKIKQSKVVYILNT